MIDIRQSDRGVSFSVKVHPRARKNAVTGEIDGALKLALTVPPVEGRANQACIDFLAEILNVPRSSVSMAAGQTSRTKVVRVTGLTAEQLSTRLSGSHD
jgi:uncharacterized protein (TIGR00251 family)